MALDQRSILAGRITWLTALTVPQRIALFFALCGAFSAAAISESVPIDAPPAVLSVEDVAHPAWQIIDSRGPGFVRETTIKAGDSANSLLARLGISDNDGIGLIASRAAKAVLQVLAPSGRVVAHLTSDGKLDHLSAPDWRGEKVITLTASGKNLNRAEAQLNLVPRIVVGSATIETSLFAATDVAGLPEAIAAGLPEVFGGRIDFLHRLRRGDRFSVIYEMLCHNGAAIKTGRILAAELVNAGVHYSSYWLDDGRGGGYYGEDGHSMQRSFLSSPVEYTRITSGYVQREHPILKKWIQHKGIDFSAPIGTPVKATAEGTIDFIGDMRGFGNFIVVKHGSIYSTAYGHLNGFASGLKRGDAVHKGEVIGYVGQTGWATGPHLHYEFRINGEHRDPETAAMPEAHPLDARQMIALRARIDTLRVALNSGARTQLAAAD